MDIDQAEQIAISGSESNHYTDVDTALSALLAEIRRLEAENAALRARAVPELRFNRMGVAESGQFTGCVADNGDWALGVYLNGILVSIEDGTGGKVAMDAAFLRLVGVQ